MVKNKPPNLEGSISDNLADYTHVIFILLFLESLVNVSHFGSLAIFGSSGNFLRNLEIVYHSPPFRNFWLNGKRQL